METWAHHAIAAACRAIAITVLGGSKVALLGLAAGNVLHHNKGSIMIVLVDQSFGA